VAEVAPSASMLSAMPNPFRNTTGIRLALAGAEGSVRVEVFDVSGRLVRAIFAGPLAAGSHSFAWDGRDSDGRSSGSGLYFLRAQTSNGTLETKLIRLQ
jgi:flagellar basal-body rod modification protein FlgD